MVPHQGTAGRYIMTAVKGKDTTPELVVRRLVDALGYRSWPAIESEH